MSDDNTIHSKGSKPEPASADAFVVSEHSDFQEKSEDRRYIYFILFIVLATTSAIILIVNSSFISRTPEAVVIDKPVEQVTIQVRRPDRVYSESGPKNSMLS